MSFLTPSQYANGPPPSPSATTEQACGAAISPILHQTNAEDDLEDWLNLAALLQDVAQRIEDRISNTKVQTRRSLTRFRNFLTVQQQPGNLDPSMV